MRQEADYEACIVVRLALARCKVAEIACRMWLYERAANMPC